MASNRSPQTSIKPAIERQQPHTAVLKIVNPVFAALLRSPLHRLLDHAFRPQLMVLDLIGRRTGRRYRIIVGRHEINGVMSLFTSMPWRLNARGGADVRITSGGRTSRARATLVEGPDEVADAYATVIRRLGWKAAQRQLGMTINVGRSPTHAELVEAVKREHLSLIRLEPA